MAYYECGCARLHCRAGRPNIVHVDFEHETRSAYALPPRNIIGSGFIACRRPILSDPEPRRLLQNCLTDTQYCLASGNSLFSIAAHSVLLDDQDPVYESVWAIEF
jgi:hypothetical protein